MPTAFVTATGTEVGKTLVTSLLVERARARGLPVRALKPLCSGVDVAAAAGSDPARLLEAMGREVTPAAVAEICPFAFAAPLSPDMAARREGRRVEVAGLVTASRPEDADEGELLLIEGVGGCMVPLNERETVLDWIEVLASPALVVAGAYLGTLSHTLTAVQALRARSVDVAGVVVSEREAGPVDLEETCASLRPHLGEVPVWGLPRLGSPRAAGGAFVDEVLAALSAA